jgi:phage shock protein A
MSDDFSKFDANIPPRDDTDLSGMDMEAAKEYVLAFMTTLKQTQRKIKELEGEMKIWQDRVTLAEQGGKADLKAGAEKKAADIQVKIDTLEGEEKDLAFKVREMLENLKKLKNAFAFSVNAEQLMAELEMIVGEKDEVTPQFKHMEAMSELEKLKQKMSSDPGKKPE